MPSSEVPSWAEILGKQGTATTPRAAGEGWEQIWAQTGAGVHQKIPFTAKPGC